MAAISYTVLALAAKGGRILTSPRLYGGAVDGFHSINTIRLSIGLEDPQDLIDDLDQAFEKAFT